MQMSEDGVLAFGNYGWGNMWSMAQPSKRRDAITRACQRCPTIFMIDSGVQCKPESGLRHRLAWEGCAKELPQRKVIYVSPIWEAADDGLVEYVVLHEMLHVILVHNTDLDRNKANERQLDEAQEQQVSDAIVQLGYPDRRSDVFQFIADIKSRLGVAS